VPRPLPARALITGATAGIGRSTAELLAGHGVEVGILAHLPAEVDETVAAIRHAGGAAFPVCADLTRREEVAGLIDRLEAEGFALDALVNNAGIGLQADVLDTREEDLRLLFEVNYFAAYLLSREALRHMARRGHGHIINISSASARRSLPGMSVYASSKAAMHSFSQALRIEAAPAGIHVTELLPMSVRTRFFESATNRAEKPYAPGWKAHTPEQIAGQVLSAFRHPLPEIYSSTLSRLVLGLDSLFPSLSDAILLSRRKKQNRS
jgi:short-subunit dehydrogenase